MGEKGRGVTSQQGQFHAPDDPRNPTVHHTDVIGKVAEEHVYVEFNTPTGREILMEVDLVGDRVVVESRGKIPPQVHFECPMCSTPQRRIICSITPPNKTLEIEPLPKTKWPYYLVSPTGSITRAKPEEVRSVPLGFKVCCSKQKLSVVEVIACKDCGTRYTLRDNVLELAR